MRLPCEKVPNNVMILGAARGGVLFQLERDGEVKTEETLRGKDLQEFRDQLNSMLPRFKRPWVNHPVRFEMSPYSPNQVRVGHVWDPIPLHGTQEDTVIIKTSDLRHALDAIKPDDALLEKYQELPRLYNYLTQDP